MRRKILVFPPALTLLIILFSIISSKAYTQDKDRNPWRNSLQLKLGYGIELWQVSDVYNNFRYEQVDNVQGNSAPLDPATNNTFSYTKYPLLFEMLTDHVYFSGDITSAPDLLLDLLNGYSTTGDNNEVEARRLSFPQFKLNFGGWLLNFIGVYAGAQYQYSTIEFQNDDRPDMMVLGSNYRGINLITYLNVNRLMFKNSFDYDWVANSKKAGTGIAQTLNSEVHFLLNKRKSFGVYAGLQYRTVSMKGPSGTPTEDWQHDGIQNEGNANYSYNFPNLDAKMLYLRAGIVLNIQR